MTMEAIASRSSTVRLRPVRVSAAAIACVILAAVAWLLSESAESATPPLTASGSVRRNLRLPVKRRCDRLVLLLCAITLFADRRSLLCRERKRPDLKFDQVRPDAFAPLDVPRRGGAIGRPHRATSPAGVWIVDAAVEPAAEEAQRVGHAQDDPLPGLRQQRQQRVGVRAVGNRHVLSQAQRIPLIHPVVGVVIGADRWIRVRDCRPRRRIEFPSLHAMPSAPITTPTTGWISGI